MGHALVVDTNVFIDLLEGNASAIRYFERHSDSIAFSAITEAELLSAPVCAHKTQRDVVQHLLAGFRKVPVDNPMVQIAGSLRCARKLGLPDAIIAATAMSLNAPIVTRNVKDFKKAQGLRVQKPY